jgi:membrane protein required for colicin V production
MNPMIFDLVVIALLLISVALGFMRGFCNEIFTLIGWIGAVIATIFFTPVLRDVGRDLIKQEWLADMATASVIFVATMGAFTALSHFVTKGIHLTKLGIVDRSLGFGFGLLRAVVMSGLCFLLFAYVFNEPKNRPDFVQEARTRPFLETSARWMKAILPLDTKIVITVKDDEDVLDKMIEGDQSAKDIEAELKKVK